jgi:3-hydroxyisobutyrate dehydrogenase-like beta-hydroxyacid dehydrogenase
LYQSAELTGLRADIDLEHPAVLDADFVIHDSYRNLCRRLATWAHLAFNQVLTFGKEGTRVKIAYLGLGIMGRPMAANLVKAGHDVTVWNRTPKSLKGAQTAATPAEAAKDAEIVWMCVADTKAVETVLFGADGVAEVLRPGVTVVDSSTIAPQATRDFAARVRAKGAEFVDAPMTGSKIGAEAGQLLFIVGGPEKAVAALDPLFRVLGKKVIRVGETGAGESAKIGMNLMIAAIFEGFAEALALTGKLGVAPEKLVELIESSMIRSGVTDYKASFVLGQDWSPNFPLRLMLKDIHLMLDAAKQEKVILPALVEIEKVYQKAVEAGHANDDYAVTVETVKNL